jgi:hypothetical protein
MSDLRQSTAQYIMMGPALDVSDASTEEVALSPSVFISKDGGTFAARNSATAISHNQDGWYRVELDATDTNTVGELIAYFQDPATHLPVVFTHQVVEEAYYDWKYGTGNLDTNITKVANVVVTGTDDFKADITNVSTYKAGSDRVWLASGTHDGSIIGTASSVSAAQISHIPVSELARFASLDTGESVAVSGSVAGLGQGSASAGNVTVGAFTTAGLAAMVNTDTGETSAATGSVAAIANGGVALTSAVVEQACEDGLVDLGWTAALATSLGTLSATAGSGGTLEVITVSDAISDPIQGAEVWISSDVAGNNIIAGTLNTNSAGQASFMLDPGTYYVWINAADYNESNPYTITVS